ncbi:MAG: glutaredoxin family protein [Chloroflexi bacterium]|nr:glutaredoxin family protein [Chloroflexota bacterium]
MQRVTLYTKEGCTLCKGVKATLLELRHEFTFLLEEVDITSNPELYDRYRETIPVVMVTTPGAGERATTTLASRIREDDLRRALSRREPTVLGLLKRLLRL